MRGRGEDFVGIFVRREGWKGDSVKAPFVGELLVEERHEASRGVVKRVEAHYSMMRREEAGADERSSVEVGPDGFLER